MVAAVAFAHDEKTDALLALVSLTIRSTPICLARPIHSARVKSNNNNNNNSNNTNNNNRNENVKNINNVNSDNSDNDDILMHSSS